MKKKPMRPAGADYLSEKLGTAIRMAMFTDDPQTTAAIFHELTLGIRNAEQAQSRLLDDAEMRPMIDRIKALIEPNAEDGRAAEGTRQGTWYFRAQRMT